jgi:hypothetical protein
MAIYGSDLTFKRPTKDQVALTNDLLSVIHQHHSKSREHLFHLCMIAYGLRTHNLTKPKSGAGGNAQGRVYKAAFKQWYEANSLDDVYGTLSNFTLYAMSGRLLEYVRWQIGQKYIAQLPSSMTALYSLSQIVWSQGDTATPDSRKQFETALIQPIKDGTKHNAFIHPHVTRKEIDALRDKLSGKATPTIKSERLAKDDTCTVVIATIKVHEDLFKFARVSGRKQVGPKLDDVKSLAQKLQKLIDEFNAGKPRFALDTNLEEVIHAYKEAQNPDFGIKILGDKTTKPKVATKRPVKKV